MRGWWMYECVDGWGMRGCVYACECFVCVRAFVWIYVRVCLCECMADVWMRAVMRADSAVHDVQV